MLIPAVFLACNVPPPTSSDDTGPAVVSEPAGTALYHFDNASETALGLTVTHAYVTGGDTKTFGPVEPGLDLEFDSDAAFGINPTPLDTFTLIALTVDGVEVYKQEPPDPDRWEAVRLDDLPYGETEWTLTAFESDLTR